MIPIEEFRAENREIKDLCTLLTASIEDYSLRQNSVVCELLDRFVARVKAHLIHEDRSIYGDLLKMHTPKARNVANHFLGNTQELKRIFNAFSRDWCRKPHPEKEHAKYIKETKEIFRLICDRIEFEENKIFPYFESSA